MESDHPPLSYRACPLVGCLGIEPSTSFLSGKRSTNELAALSFAVRRARYPRTTDPERRGRELNPCIEVLQTPALPLRHRAV